MVHLHFSDAKRRLRLRRLGRITRSRAKGAPDEQALGQDLAILCDFKVPDLKELLLAQTLFNVSISQDALQGMCGSAA